MNKKDPFSLFWEDWDEILDRLRLLEAWNREIRDRERELIKNDKLLYNIFEINNEIINDEKFIKKESIFDTFDTPFKKSWFESEAERDRFWSNSLRNTELEPLLDFFRSQMWDVINSNQPINPIFDISNWTFPEISEWENTEARDYMRENFWKSMFALFETLRHSPELWEKVREYIVWRDSDGMRKSEKYRIDLQRAKAQRDLSPIEEMYIESVEELSKFNPFLVALLREARQESYEYMCHHFDSLSERTWENLENGMYVPQLQIGTWPEGLSFFAEQTRRNPSISANTLVVDVWSQPWGPFAIPEWEAWRLNSSNNIDDTIYNLPDSVTENQLRWSVRWYSSPFKWYPWERTTWSPDVRKWSINIASDFSPTPDMISDSRYATNFDAQLVFAAQATVLMKNMCMSTEFVSAKPSWRVEWKWSEEITLRRTFPDGRVEQKVIYTDKIINATWLWETWYGFTLEWTRAEKILSDEDTLKWFPRISWFLDSLKLLSSERWNIEPPETITIWGLWDSWAILIEELAWLFKTKNPLIRNIKKIYIITDWALSDRPRYAAIRDVLPRWWRWNIVEIVPWRVWDIGYSEDQGDKMNIYSSTWTKLKTSWWDDIETDVYISATWLKKNIDTAYERYFTPWSEVRKKPIKLPTNNQISVWETLEWKDNIVFVGTTSDPAFNFSKLNQLPDLSRQALERVGTENAVAIWFRSQDAQASARIITPQRVKTSTIDLQKSKAQRVSEIDWDNKKWQVPKSDNTWFKLVKNASEILDLLMGMISYELVNSWISTWKNMKLTLDIRKNSQGFEVKVHNRKRWVSNQLQLVLIKVLSEERIQAYMSSLLKSYKSRKDWFRLHLSTTTSWKFSFSDSYLELV